MADQFNKNTLFTPQTNQTNINQAVPSWINFIGTTILTGILLFFSFQLFFTPQPFILLDYANFLIHETGGILFIFFGQFIFMLGQNIYQILVPFLFFFYFWRKRKLTSWAFCIFWLGDNLIQTGLYMKDARSMALSICSIWDGFECGPEGHDWHYLFSHMGLLSYDEIIGNFFWFVGALCIVISLGVLLSTISVYIHAKIKKSNFLALE